MLYYICWENMRWIVLYFQTCKSEYSTLQDNDTDIFLYFDMFVSPQVLK